jgi:4-hydroxy-tetrahydrodipicolinate synthase
MHEDGALDYDSLRKLIEFHISEGTDAIVAVGTTGESATLSVSEHTDVIKAVIDMVDGRVPVIAGTGANSTSEAIELTEKAKTLGADAALLVAPYYNKPTQEGMYLHFKAIAEAVDLPQILYNVPGRTACDLLPETVGRLSQIPNIIGIKEAAGDVSRVQQIRQLSNDDFEIYTGEDVNTVDFILAGGCGVISVTANVAPRLMHDMCMAAIDGDEAKAREINQKLVALHQFLFVETNPIPVKWALSEMAMIPKGIRLPMTVLSEKYHQSVREALITAGVLNSNSSE